MASSVESWIENTKVMIAEGNDSYDQANTEGRRERVQLCRLQGKSEGDEMKTIRNGGAHGKIF